MPSLALDTALIWFAHCPKAGGTSVETVMTETWGPRVGHLHWGWDRWWRAGGWREAAPPCSPQHLTWADALPRLERPPDHVFAVVREPLARMRSEQRWQRRGRGGTALGRALAFLPFALWLRVMLRLARGNPYAFDNHFRPQGDFVPGSARVFRLEEGLGPVIGWLAQTTGEPLPGRPPHRLGTGQAPRPADPRDVALVAETFAADYARFGYPRPAVSTSRRAGLDLIAAGLAPLLLRLERRGRL